MGNASILGWVSVLAALALGACADPSPKEPAEPLEPIATHYTLRVGEVTRHPRPLPVQSDIIVDWHYDNGTTASVTGFRGWDFVGDGRYQMIEVLAEDGRTVTRLYDFDGDGRVDLTEETTLPAPAALPPPSPPPVASGK